MMELGAEFQAQTIRCSVADVRDLVAPVDHRNAFLVGVRASKEGDKTLAWSRESLRWLPPV
jgi:hypothetical protein